MKHGMNAIIESGFPHELLALTMLLANNLHVSLAVRAGQPPNVCKGFEVAAKPISIKTKTCHDQQHVPCLSGFITKKQKIFGRDNYIKIPKNNFNFVPLHVSLCDILNDYLRGEYDELQYHDGVLSFKAKHANENIKNHVSFQIDLTKGEKSITYDNALLKKLAPWLPNHELSPPDFWNEQLGDFSEALKNLYPISYSWDNSAYQSIEVVADEAGKPITGDADILWAAIPIQFGNEMINKQYNTNIFAEYHSLLQNLNILITKLHINLTPQQLTNAATFAKTAGIITPYELLLEVMVNEQFFRAMPYISNLYQHGPETNNPGAPSSLNSKILHFYEGMLILTENEEELIEFILQPGYLEKYYIAVPSTWDMQKWSPVLSRQIELKQPIRPETLQKYFSYYQALSVNSVPATTRKPLILGETLTKGKAIATHFMRLFNHKSTNTTEESSARWAPIMAAGR